MTNLSKSLILVSLGGVVGSYLSYNYLNKKDNEEIKSNQISFDNIQKILPGLLAGSVIGFTLSCYK